MSVSANTYAGTLAYDDVAYGDSITIHELTYKGHQISVHLTTEWGGDGIWEYRFDATRSGSKFPIGPVYGKNEVGNGSPAPAHIDLVITQVPDDSVLRIAGVWTEDQVPWPFHGERLVVSES